MTRNFEELENLLSAAIAAGEPGRFDDLALEVYRYQREYNPPYDQYCRLLGAGDSPAGWREIPALLQAAFKYAALRSFPAAKEIAAFHTSGTTGADRGVHHFSSLRLYDEAVLRGWDLLGLQPLPQIILIAHPSDAPHSSLSHMMGTLKARAANAEQHWCINTHGQLDLDRLRDLVDEFSRRGQPVMLLGTALAFLHWFEALEGSSLALPIGSLAFETGGYKGSGRTLSKASLYAMFQKRLGLAPDDIINEYGMTELSSQCYTRGLDRPHTAPPWVRTIAVNPATGREVADGETGLLQIYDLANLGSVFAIQTRDLAIRRGADFELLGRDPAALPRGCSRAADVMLSATS
jgi:acyl-CoA synthetase (AMP-forming)/AMP-acid ligase II